MDWAREPWPFASTWIWGWSWASARLPWTLAAGRSSDRCSSWGTWTSRWICRGTRCSGRRPTNGERGTAARNGNRHGSTSVCSRSCWLFQFFIRISSFDLSWVNSFNLLRFWYEIVSKYSRALFVMDVLLERIQIQESQYLSSRAVAPEWSNHFNFCGTSVSERISSK